MKSPSLRRYVNDYRPPKVFLLSQKEDVGGRNGLLPLYMAETIPSICTDRHPCIPEHTYSGIAEMSVADGD